MFEDYDEFFRVWEARDLQAAGEELAQAWAACLRLASAPFTSAYPPCVRCRRPFPVPPAFVWVSALATLAALILSL